MVGNITSSSLVQRLQKLLLSRYGKELSLSLMTEAASSDLLLSEPFVAEGNFRVPISEGGRFLGMATIPKADDLSEVDRNDIANLIRLILQPALYNLFLKNTQSQFAPSFFELVGPSAIDQESLDDEPSAHKTGRKQVPLIVLESHNPSLIPKLSLEIHHSIQRWAYLNYKQISVDLNTVGDFLSLGAMTIFIEDVLYLSPSEQDTINQYLDQGNAKEHPLLIVGATSPVEHLIEHLMVSKTFGDKLLRARLHLNRLPQNSALLRESVQLLLDPQTYIH